MRSIFRVCLIILAFLTVPAVAFRSDSLAGPARKDNLDVTFLVTADLHFGATTVMTTKQKAEVTITCAEAQQIMITEMNNITGKPFPKEVGGEVGRPLGLLIAGDLTEYGKADQWQEFVKFYGLTGREGQLKMPVHESLGNHDRYEGDTVSRGIVERHKGEHYSWDVGDLHMVCLGEPNDVDLAFLQKDLEPIGHRRPVVIYFHYSISGPYSKDFWFGMGDKRTRFAAALKGYNVIALFHGHFHGSGWYKWKGYDVYNVGAVKHGSKDFIVLHVTDNKLTVAAWNYEGTPGWWWLHSKPINGAPGQATVKVYPHAGAHARPCIPYPLGG